MPRKELEHLVGTVTTTIVIKLIQNEWETFDA